MQFYFIRHAQSTNNLLFQKTQSSAGRSDDPGLTEQGCEQAQYLARFLQQPTPSPSWDGSDGQNVTGFGITHLYTSLMIRAVITATLVGDALGLPPIGWKDLHENGGIYLDDEQGNPQGQAGKSRSYFAEHFPRLILPDDVDEQGWWNRPYEAEEERLLRAKRVLQTLLARHGGTEDRVAVISHGGFYNYLMAALLDIPRKNGLWYVLNNVAISRIDFCPEWVDIVYQNRLDFLPKELIT